MRFIEHRVADRRILRLIQKWLKAGVSEDGQWLETKVGTPQGAVVSVSRLPIRRMNSGPPCSAISSRAPGCRLSLCRRSMK
jgi:retron-type reverse transcriptase